MKYLIANTLLNKLFNYNIEEEEDTNKDYR